MTIVEESIDYAVAQQGDVAGGVDLLSAFLEAYRSKVLAWMDAHADDTVVKVLGLFRVRVRHVRALVEMLID